mmetsp:Transcript_32921/g.64572  ORF Transcript_32921/g.64572 Transcript_32921/m.64572 type:complete len:154 (-) Transcript_32921:472-933(-)
MLCSLLQASNQPLALGNILAVLFLHPFQKVFDNTMVKIFTPQVSISRSGQHLKNSIVNRQHRDIKSTTTKIVHEDVSVLVTFVQTVCDCCGSRFVDNSQDIETCNLASIFGGLALSVVKIGGYSDNSRRNFFAKVRFCDFLHTSQNHTADLFR